jgi:hypothetical protein
LRIIIPRKFKNNYSSKGYLGYLAGWYYLFSPNKKKINLTSFTGRILGPYSTRRILFNQITWLKFTFDNYGVIFNADKKWCYEFKIQKIQDNSYLTFKIYPEVKEYGYGYISNGLKIKKEKKMK